MSEATPSEVAAFYRNRSVLVTGGSGFMGKVLLEKLLYVCTDLSSIYILMRPKREKTPQVRLEEMTKLPVFQRIREERPHMLKKLVIVQGDIEKENLGLSEADVDILLKNVSVVFHSGATLRLEAKLKDAVKINLVGTWNVLQLCQKMKQLKVFIHSSTAFSHCDYEVLEERVYPVPFNPHDIMRIIKWMDDSMVDSITPKLIEPHPNTYTFTKRLAEGLVAEQFDQMPVVIARPSIVTPSWLEPVPGWVDSLNGPVGLMAAAGKGVIRSMLCNSEMYSQVIPVDLAINAIVTIAAKEGSVKERPSDIPVYNITAGDTKCMKWGEVLDKSRKLVDEYPFEMTVWYPGGNIRTSKFIHYLCVIFLHYLPAYLIDFLMFVFRQKRFMVHIQNRIQNGLELLQFFTTRQWVFRNDKFLALRNSQNPTDKAKFNMDVETVDEDIYLVNSALGARHYSLKEDPKSLPKWRIIIKVLYVVDILWTLSIYSFLLWLLVSYSETARYILDMSVNIIKTLPILRNFFDQDLFAS